MSNDRTYVVSESSIHGKGLFAARDIDEGELIGEITGEETQDDGPHVLWIVEEDGTETGLRATNDLRFVNHSGDGNAHFEGTELYALRAIDEGEEITFDYDTGLEDEDEWADEDVDEDSEELAAG